MSERRTRPPRITEWVLERVLLRRDREWILGDMHEEYERRVRASGKARATRWYRGQAMRAVLPSVQARFAGARASSAQPDRGSGAAGPMAFVHALANGLARDARSAARALERRPAYALMCAGTLGVAIGASAAMFGVIDAVLLRSMPYPDVDRIILFSEMHPERMREHGWASVPDMLDWQASARSFESIGLFRGRSMAVTDGDPAYVYGAFVTPGFFRVFGVDASMGRVLREGDDGVAGPAAVVISHGFWLRRYGGDPGLVGRTITVDGIARTVAGVMPASFSAPADFIGVPLSLDVWVPFVLDPSESRANRSYSVVGRLRPDVGLSGAAAEMTSLDERLRREHPDDNAGWRVRIDPWKEMIVGDSRRILLLVAAAIGLVLLVACANVGNLVLNRALGRRGEFALRAALGGGAMRIVRAAALEAVLLALGGGIMGLGVARVLVYVVQRLEPGQLPRLADASVDGRVLLATLGTSMLIGVVVGVIPALVARSRAPVSLLTGAGRATTVSRTSRRVRDGMLVAQLVLALAMLAGSALVTRAFLRMRTVSPGFDPDGVLTATVVLSWDRVPTMDRRVAFTTAVLERLRTAPGVISAGMINSLPLSGSDARQPFTVAGRPAAPGEAPFAAIRSVDPGYFETMRIPVRGRAFTDADIRQQPAVALVNDAFVRQYLQGENATGSRLLLMDGALAVDIVGTTGDVRHYGLDRPARPEIYLPYTADFLSSKTFVIRTAGDPYALAQSVRSAVHAVDPVQPLRAVGGGLGSASTVSMSDLVAASVAAPRFHAFVLITLAGLAVLLSAVGLFAVISQTVAERSREIGIRMALGAGRATVVRWILAWSGRLALAGTLGGLLLAIASSRMLSSFLFGANPRDPTLLSISAAAFLAIAAAASLLPALRATRIDPTLVIRDS